ncbi:MAG: hypothetical protein AB8G18_13100 [Gammaproteobacteria bacterium]
MNPRIWITIGITLFVGILLSWIKLGTGAQWPMSIIAISAAPLGVTLLSLFSLGPKPFFYAALTLMLYIAFVITQIAVVPSTRLDSALVLGVSLAYLTVLKFVLQALNARRGELSSG